jgi:hypothetical protein
MTEEQLGIKQELNHRSEFETQQISMPNMKNHVSETGIDLRKIRDIRRALRRRYIRCKNFNRIFTAWDRESKGRISV